MYLNASNWKMFCKVKQKELRLCLGIIINLIIIITYQDIRQYIFHYQYRDWLKVFTSALIIWLFLKELTFGLLGVKRNIISMIFMLAVYLFYFSHIFLLAVGYNYGSHRNDFAVFRYGESVYMQSMETTINLVMALYFGFLISSVIKCPIKLKHVSKLSGKNIWYLGITIICITVPFFAVGIVRFLSYVSKSGYAYAINNAGYDINTYAHMRMSLVGFVLCMLSCHNEKYAKKIIMAAGMLYFLAMFSGQRAYNLMFIVILCFIYFIRYREMRISFQTVIITFVITFLLIMTINLIRNTRAEGMNLSLLRTSFLNQSSDSIYDLLREFGITENAIVYTYMNRPEPQNGIQLYTSFIVAIPGIANFFPHINYSMANVSDALDMWNFGGALISDVIFDFGNNAYIICLLIGIILQKFYEFYIYTIYRRRILLGAYLSPLLCEIIFCVRSTAYKIPRLIFLYGVLMAVFIIFYVFVQILSSISWKGWNT